jgi:tetratricopeptide (TPR) repeat protein
MDRYKFSASTGGPPEPSYEEAERLSSSKQLREAADMFEVLSSHTKDPLETANFLIEEAECFRQLGEFERARECTARARKQAADDLVACAQVESFAAKILISEGKQEEGVSELSRILKEYPGVFEDPEGRELYNQIQIQRGFTLMHLAQYSDARGALEEVDINQLAREIRADLHSHLGACYVELGLYSSAADQFQPASEIGVSDDWAPTFHYYFAYALYKLKKHAAAKRELLLCCQATGGGPPRNDVYRMLSTVCYKLGESREARLYERLAKSSKDGK